MNIPAITTNQTLIEMANSPAANIRADAARNEQTGEDILSRLISDPDETVRAAVADRGYGIDTLVKDESEIVRHSVAYNGYCFDILMNDPDDRVREAVAAHGWHIEEMVNDPSPAVRETIAMQGVATEQYLNDQEINVKRAALASLFESLPKDFAVLSCDVSEIQGEEKEAVYCEIMPKNDLAHKIGFWIDTFENGRVAVYNDEVFMDMAGNSTSDPIPENYIRQITESLEKDGAKICETVTKSAQMEEDLKKGVFLGAPSKNNIQLLSHVSKKEITER